MDDVHASMSATRHTFKMMHWRSSLAISSSDRDLLIETTDHTKRWNWRRETTADTWTIVRLAARANQSSINRTPNGHETTCAPCRKDLKGLLILHHGPRPSTMGSNRGSKSKVRKHHSDEWSNFCNHNWACSLWPPMYCACQPGPIGVPPWPGCYEDRAPALLQSVAGALL